MRGKQDRQGVIGFFLNVEDPVPRDRPLRAIRALANEQLERISSMLDAAYAAYAENNGRPRSRPSRSSRRCS